MEFIKNYEGNLGIDNGIRTRWTTRFYIDDYHINTNRTINGKIRSLRIPYKEEETLRDILTKVSNITKMDTDMYIQMSDIQKRTQETQDDE
jgi:hypothetical protein